jgi:hypothetical protein
MPQFSSYCQSMQQPLPSESVGSVDWKSRMLVLSSRASLAATDQLCQNIATLKTGPMGARQ